MNKKSKKQLKTSSLQNELISKNKVQFWKLWNANFKVSKKSATIDVLRSSQETADYFATKMQDSCKPNSVKKINTLKVNLRQNACNTKT